MIMNLLIVRHAESLGNLTRYATPADDSLSELGQKQAFSLVDSLRKWDFDEIVVSPLNRTQETIAPYLLETDQHAHIWPEISEACWHQVREAPGTSWKSQPATLRAAPVDRFSFRNDEAIMPSESETFAEGFLRVNNAVKMIQAMADAGTQSVLMVSHGQFLRELINVMLNTRYPILFSLANCGMTLLSFKGTWNMQFSNRLVDLKQTAGDASGSPWGG